MGDGVRLDDGNQVMLAGRIARFVAVTLDWCFTFPPIFLLVITELGLRVFTSDLRPATISRIAGLLAFCVLAIQTLFLARDGQTVAKKLLGQRIVRRDGSRVGVFRMIALRYIVPWLLGGFVPFVGFLFFIIDGLAIFARDRRCLHDYMADTVVIDVRTVPSAARMSGTRASPRP